MVERLSKHTILRKRKLIRQLFTDGHVISIAGLQLRWLHTNENMPVSAQVLFAVPKHRVPKATDRNSIKRRMREAFRKHQCMLFDPLHDHHRKGLFAFVYTHREIHSQREITDKIIVLLQRLNKENEKASG